MKTSNRDRSRQTFRECAGTRCARQEKCPTSSVLAALRSAESASVMSDRPTQKAHGAPDW